MNFNNYLLIILLLISIFLGCKREAPKNVVLLKDIEVINEEYKVILDSILEERIAYFRDELIAYGKREQNLDSIISYRIKRAINKGQKLEVVNDLFMRMCDPPSTPDCGYNIGLLKTSTFLNQGDLDKLLGNLKPFLICEDLVFHNIKVDYGIQIQFTFDSTIISNVDCNWYNKEVFFPMVNYIQLEDSSSWYVRLGNSKIKGDTKNIDDLEIYNTLKTKEQFSDFFDIMYLEGTRFDFTKFILKSPK